MYVAAVLSSERWPIGFLIDQHDDLVDLVEPLEAVQVPRRRARGSRGRAGEGQIEDAVHQRRLTGAAHPRDGDQRRASASRFEVVLVRAAPELLARCRIDARPALDALAPR